MNNEQIMEFRIASQNWEFQQIHELNYQTFVEEIPQHDQNRKKMLVDKFHEQNTYIICVRHDQVIGMLALRDQRPFSLDHKLDNIEQYLPEAQRLCEVRLLAVKKEYRNTLIFTGLLKSAMRYCLDNNYDLALISGTVRQLRLYKHLGFSPFGPLVGSKGARYQPMYIDYSAASKLLDSSKVFRDFKFIRTDTHREIKNYLPGPVTIADPVKRMFTADAVSHRGADFKEKFNQLRKKLCQKLNAEHVQIMHGSGTLANDIVASYLKALPGKGLILVNGEFSKRLTLHAKSAGLDFDCIYFEEGTPAQVNAVEDYLQQNDSPDWLWTTWCETSTGVINDIDEILKLANQHEIKLCVDAISAIGSLPVNLHDIYLATAVSGKGLASLAGLSLVFYRDDLLKPESIPRYFDLELYAQNDGLPFTISSNAIDALDEAVNQRDWENDIHEKQQWYHQLADQLAEIGLEIVANKNPAYHIISIQLP
ncbi:MAG: aminotransferase class V-fold PLP-dependent enzyme, partial [Thioalkalispiraceae bacterium]